MTAISTATNLEELPHIPAEEPNARFPPEIKSETASQTRGSTSTRPSLPTKAGAACTSSSPAMWTARRCCADPAPAPTPNRWRRCCPPSTPAARLSRSTSPAREGAAENHVALK